MLVFLISAAFPVLANAASPSVTIEAATELTSEKATLNATVNPNGIETTYRFEYGLTTSYGTNVPIPDKAIGSGSGNVKVSQEISGLVSSTTYHFRVVAKNAEGTSTSKDETFTTNADPRFSFAFGSAGSGNGQFSEEWGPSYLAIDSTGNLWVGDPGNDRVQKFNSKGEYVSKFGSKPLFKHPQGIAIDSSGNLWIADCENNFVQKFDSAGKWLSLFGSEGSGNGQFSCPSGLAIDSTGNLWVVDRENNRVQKFNSKGEYVSKFGSGGSGNGQFNFPQGIAIDSTGNIWVADSGNDRVQKFNSKGEYVSKFGSSGSGNGQFAGPVGIAINSSGALLVTDEGNSRVQKFNSKGEYLVKFGTEGSGEGQFNWPLGVAVDSSDNIWVADSFNSRVQKWSPIPPSVNVEAATELTFEKATLNASVNPNGYETTYHFEYGLTTSYGTSVPIPDGAVGSGSSNV
ncbi:MAG TPA: 6-bladed beta-propeller, partial [Solirubrobacterales bacterium]|nr:6-bladed beta-propeller [Solirubrobacterales bacterium]